MLNHFRRLKSSGFIYVKLHGRIEIVFLFSSATLRTNCKKTSTCTVNTHKYKVVEKFSLSTTVYQLSGMRKNCSMSSLSCTSIQLSRKVTRVFQKDIWNGTGTPLFLIHITYVLYLLPPQLIYFLGIIQLWIFKTKTYFIPAPPVWEKHLVWGGVLNILKCMNYLTEQR